MVVYPRWRGEHWIFWRLPWFAPGLSPLARGTPVDINHVFASYRFIPAGAGNTGGTAPATRADAVYPRWRGEHAFATARAAPEAGLSPLARGTL